MTLSAFTIEDIRKRGPCYDPARYLPENWSGTALDVLRHAEIPPHDKLWVVCYGDIIDDKTLRLFVVWCARQVQHLMLDPRSIAALDTAEKYAHGEASREELDAAWAAAWDAAGAAAWDAAWDAAYGIVSGSVLDTNRKATLKAAWNTARVAQVAQLIKMLEGL